jgi:hypothetical protein
VPGVQCPDDYSKYTVDDAMVRLGKYYAFNMLQWRADPYMFHQANLVCQDLVTCR